MNVPRIASLGAIAAAGLGAAVLASGSLLIDSAPTSIEGSAQSAHPSQVQLACPSGLVDPFNTTNVAAATTWSSLSGTPISPAPASVNGTGGVIPTPVEVLAKLEAMNEAIAASAKGGE